MTVTKPTIIPVGIAGPMGSGKSTVCGQLMRTRKIEAGPVTWGWAFYTASHAAPLKLMLEAMGVPQQQLYGSQADKAKSCEVLLGKSARHAMQTLGTEWGRKCIGSKVWLNCFNREVRRIGEDETETGLSHVGVPSDDVRFPNEVENIQEQGGLVFWLTGRQLSNNDEEQASHRSEQDLSKLPGVIVIDNSSYLDITVTQINNHIIDAHTMTNTQRQPNA